jgi:hypothetical protein
MMKRYALYVILALSCLLPVKQTIADKKQNMFESRLKNAGKTNIVFILADDMSYYDMSGLGQKHFDTPNLDELMHEGLFFHQAYSGSPECAPSRGSLLTGMHMGHCRIRCNRSFRGQDHLEAEQQGCSGSGVLGFQERPVHLTNRDLTIQSDTTTSSGHTDFSPTT